MVVHKPASGSEVWVLVSTEAVVPGVPVIVGEFIKMILAGVQKKR
jgi:hypothetical protein